MTTEERLAVLESKVEKLDDVTTELKSMTETIIKLTAKFDIVSDLVTKIDRRVEAMEAGPKETVKLIRNTIITALVTGAVSSILTAVIVHLF